jgi:hypothetical protein
VKEGRERKEERRGDRRKKNFTKNYHNRCKYSLTNQMQQCVKKLYITTKLYLFQLCKIDSLFENQLM